MNEQSWSSTHSETFVHNPKKKGQPKRKVETEPSRTKEGESKLTQRFNLDRYESTCPILNSSEDGAYEQKIISAQFLRAETDEAHQKSRFRASCWFHERRR